jgi:hypothetical protein
MRTIDCVAERQLNREHVQSAPQLLMRRSATRLVHPCPYFGERPVSTGRYTQSARPVHPIGERPVSTGRYAHLDSIAVLMRKDREANASRSPVVESCRDERMFLQARHMIVTLIKNNHAEWSDRQISISGVNPPATIKSRSAKSVNPICSRAATDGSSDFQGRDRLRL